MTISQRTTLKTGKALVLIFSIVFAFHHSATAQEYWKRTEAQFWKETKRTWSQKEIAQLLGIAMPDEGLTDRKVAALEELVAAVAHKSTLPDGFEESILTILARPEAGITNPTAQIVGNLKIEAARSELESWASIAYCDSGVEALRALVCLGGERTQEFLRKLYLRKCTPPKSVFGSEASDETPLERANILCALIELDPERTAPDVVTHLSKFPNDFCNDHIYEMIFTHQSGPAAFTRALKDKHLPTSAARLGIGVASTFDKDLDNLIEALMKAGNIEKDTIFPARKTRAEQGGADQPASAPRSKAE